MSGPTFLADAMLARLARWLRILGFDTLYDPLVHDPELVRISNESHRVLLTRDRHLLRELRPLAALEILLDDPIQQLSQMVVALELRPPTQLFSRCTVCNTALSPPLPVPEAKLLVPQGVRDMRPVVRRCPTCLRVYWNGSHTRRMRAAIERELPGWLRAEA